MQALLALKGPPGFGQKQVSPAILHLRSRCDFGAFLGVSGRKRHGPTPPPLVPTPQPPNLASGIPRLAEQLRHEARQALAEPGVRQEAAAVPALQPQAAAQLLRRRGRSRASAIRGGVGFRWLASGFPLKPTKGAQNKERSTHTHTHGCASCL